MEHSPCLSKPSFERPNLRLLTQTHVQRITFENGRATGVQMSCKGEDLLGPLANG